MRIPKIKNTKRFILFISVISTFAVFLLDMALPFGTVVWIFYTLIILSALLTKGKHHPEALAIFCSVFMLIKLASVSDEILFPMRFFNRFSGLVLIWIIAWLVNKRIAEEIRIEQYANNLREEIRDKEKMMSVLAHDLKSPFQGLIGFTDLLLEETTKLKNKNIHEQVMVINSLSKDTFEMLITLLEWAKNRLGRVNPAPQLIYASKAIEEALKTSQSRASQKKIQIVNIVKDTAIVYADPEMLAAVFRNLINNAIKFSYQGDYVVISGMPSGNMYEFYIKDNGVGISEELLENLFNRNTNESMPGTDSEKGTGLGISICKDFLYKMGGSVWAESAPGRGSKFIFAVPISMPVLTESDNI